MSAKIDANRDRLEAAYQWLAFKVHPLLLMGCIVVPAFIGSYAYTSWQQTKIANYQPMLRLNICQDGAANALNPD
jgi:hypothetical protein